MVVVGGSIPLAPTRDPLADVRAQHFFDLAVKCRDMVVRQPEVE
jgi:hypothetical protein